MNKKCNMKCSRCKDKCHEYVVAEFLHQKGVILAGREKKKCAKEKQ